MFGHFDFHVCACCISLQTAKSILESYQSFTSFVATLPPNTWHKGPWIKPSKLLALFQKSTWFDDRNNPMLPFESELLTNHSSHILKQDGLMIVWLVSLGCNITASIMIGMTAYMPCIWLMCRLNNLRFWKKCTENPIFYDKLFTYI